MSQVVTLLSLITKKFEYKDDLNELKPLGLYSKIKDQAGAEARLYLTEDLPRFSLGLTWLLDYIYRLGCHICKESGESEDEINKFEYFGGRERKSKK